MRDDLTSTAPDPTLVDRFLSGEATKEETTQIRAWAGKGARIEWIADSVRDALRQMGSRPTEVDDYQRVLGARLGLPRGIQNATSPPSAPHAPAQSPQRRAPQYLSRRIRRSILGAGVTLGCVIAGMIVWKTQSPTINERTYRTDTEEYAVFTLSDGSEVQLAPNSRITIPGDFGHRTRTVSLQGVASFSVPHTIGIPFLVRTGEIETRVLGTVFDVHHDPVRNDVRVVVISGKVSTGWLDGQRSVALTAGMVSHLRGSTASVSVIPALEKHFDRNTKQLVFLDTRLADVLATVGGWYGVELRLADSLQQHERVTTSLESRNLAAAVRALRLLADTELTVTLPLPPTPPHPNQQ